MSDPGLSVYAGQYPSAPSDAREIVDGRALLRRPSKCTRIPRGVWSLAVRICVFYDTRGSWRGSLLDIIILSLTHLPSLLEFSRVFIPFGDFYLVPVQCLLSSKTLEIFFSNSH